MAIISDSKINAHPLRLQIQKLFQKDLAWENDYLRQENRILRSKFEKRIPLTDADRRTLVKYGMRIRDRLADVTSIVKPETILAWNRRMKKRKWTYDNTPKKPGRPRKSAETDVLILRLAEENATWGYWRIAGELKKLGHVASKSHVRDVLKRHGICQMRMTAGGYHGAQPTSVARTMISNNCSAWSGVPPPPIASLYMHRSKRFRVSGDFALDWPMEWYTVGRRWVNYAPHDRQCSNNPVGPSAGANTLNNRWSQHSAIPLSQNRHILDELTRDYLLPS